MGPEFWITSIVIIAMFVGAASNRVPIDAAFFGAISLFAIFGIITPGEALSGFSNPSVITIAALFVIGCGLKETGAITYISHYMLGTKSRKYFSHFRLVFPSSFISGFFNNTPFVAMTMPIVLGWCKRHNLSPSKFLIPLSYASMLGGMCTLIGTSPNLLVNGMLMVHTGGDGLGMIGD